MFHTRGSVAAKHRSPKLLFDPVIDWLGAIANARCHYQFRLKVDTIRDTLIAHTGNLLPAATAHRLKLRAISARTRQRV